MMKHVKLFEQFLNERKYSDEQRMDMADKGLALPDGSFPIKDLKDLKNAIQAYGRSKDQAATAKFIAKRAKELSAEDLIPNTEDFQKSLNEQLFPDVVKVKKSKKITQNTNNPSDTLPAGIYKSTGREFDGMHIYTSKGKKWFLYPEDMDIINEETIKGNGLGKSV